MDTGKNCCTVAIYMYIYIYIYIYGFNTGTFLLACHFYLIFLLGMVGMFFILSWFDISFANTILITLAKLIVKLSVLCEINQNSRYVEAVKVFFYGGYEITHKVMRGVGSWQRCC